MDVLATVIAIAELALWAIIIYYVCTFIGMPDNPRRVCQALVILIAIFASLQIVLGSHAPVASRTFSTPSIIAPERR